MSTQHASIPKRYLYDCVNEVPHGYSLNLNAFGIPISKTATPPGAADWAAREYDLELPSEKQFLEEAKSYEALDLNSSQQLVFDSARALVDGEASLGTPDCFR